MLAVVVIAVAVTVVDVWKVWEKEANIQLILGEPEPILALNTLRLGLLFPLLPRQVIDAEFLLLCTTARSIQFLHR